MTTHDTTDGPRLLYSIPDAANQLSVSESTLRRKIDDGQIPVTRLGARVLVPHTALVDYIAANTTTAS